MCVCVWDYTPGDMLLEKSNQPPDVTGTGFQYITVRSICFNIPVFETCPVWSERSVNLAAVETEPWLLSMSEHLPQRHTEHPGITGVRESPGLQALWSTPDEAHHV